METFVYQRGAELPGLTLPWQEQVSASQWDDLDLSSGHTFVLTLTDLTGAVVLTKTTGLSGILGAALVSWEVDDLDIEPGPYELRLRATETASGKDRDFSPSDPIVIIIEP